VVAQRADKWNMQTFGALQGWHSVATPFVAVALLKRLSGTVRRGAATECLPYTIHEKELVNFKQTGDGTSATCPVALSLPVLKSRRKTTMLSDF
jgi:hypothetical protein